MVETTETPAPPPAAAPTPRWRSWAEPVLLYAVALAARAFFLTSAPYGDEAHHYFIARGFGTPPANLVGGADTHWLFVWRPLFSAFLAPGAQVSFTGFRLDYMLLVSVLAPALLLWVKQRGGSPWTARAAGLVAALHPFFVTWGVRAFPDELMAAAFVVGLLLWEGSRWLAGAALLLAAVWVKEVALVGVAVLLAEDLLADSRLDASQLTFTLRLRRRQVFLAGVLALAWLPHQVAVAMGGRLPGWSRGGDLPTILDDAFTTLWFLPVVVAALLSRKARRPALLGLAYVAFYAFYHVVVGGRTELWYNVLPAVLGTAAIALALQDFAAWLKARKAPVARSVRHAGTVLVAAILLAQVLVPGTSEAKLQVLHPGTATHELSAAEAIHAEQTRDRDLWTVVDAATPKDWKGVLLVDVPWFFSYYPFSDRAGAVGGLFTEGNPSTAAQWSTIIETLANMTVLKRTDGALNRAMQEVYAPCVGLATGEYLLIRGQGCPGKAAELDAAWARNR